jgi:hypothetical protein
MGIHDVEKIRIAIGKELDASLSKAGLYWSNFKKQFKFSVETRLKDLLADSSTNA